MKFDTDIHDAKWMTSDDLGDLLTFARAPPAGQGFRLSRKKYLLDANNKQMLCRHSFIINPNSFGDPLTFPLPPTGQFLLSNTFDYD